MKPWLICLLALIPASAGAQTPPAEPPAEEIRAVPSRPAQLVLPALPEQPTELKANIERLGRIAVRTDECWSSNEERFTHVPDRRCAGWFTQLTRDRVAGVFAMGLRIVTATAPAPAVGHAVPPSSGNFDRTLPRLAEMMAQSQLPEAVPFLINALGNSANSDGSSRSVDLAIVTALQKLTGLNPRPFPPWQHVWDLPDGASARTFGAEEWLNWYAAHRAETRDQWLAAADQDAVQKLNATDDVVRFNAIERLMTRPAQRAAATTALRAMLARTDLPANVRFHLTQLAQANAITVPRTRAAAAAVRAR